MPGKEEEVSKLLPKYIIGIGASAGGLEAIQSFFEQIPSNTGAAFIIIQHLSPDFKSLMGQLLQRTTKMKIHPASNNVEVEANTIYLIPPKQNMYISQGKLELVEQNRDQYLNLPIDLFFESLAKECGNQAIGVILSGTGSDGSKGIVELAKVGALTLVQEPSSAKFDGMPRNAITTQMIDCVLPIEKISRAIVSYMQDPASFQLSNIHNHLAPISSPNARIFGLLISKYKVDFSLYKPATVSRRFQRRLQALNLTSLEDYLELLSKDSVELDLLYNDMLIGVSNFFRDPEAFLVLQEQVIPAIVKKHEKTGKSIRVWVPACSTGEEAYSIGILFKECLLARSVNLDVKIFATDISKEFIERASSGSYSVEQLNNVSAERLKRFFMPAKRDVYQIVPDIRNMVVFAQHNLITDPPFTRMDLVSCRNFLIYVQPPIQKKIISFLLFALNIKGYLFLGPSETLGTPGHELDIISSSWKIFEKIANTRQMLNFSQTSFTNETVTRNQHAINSAISLPEGRAQQHGLPLFAYDLLLDRVIDDGLLVDNRREVIHVFGTGKRFIQFESGRVSMDLVSIIIPELKSPLTTALHRSGMDKQEISYVDIPVKILKQSHLINMVVTPLLDQKDRVVFTLIRFEETKNNGSDSSHIVQAYSASDVSDKVVKELEYELQKTKESLQATIEVVETTNEELQSTNEELLASNEELQSTNEELHSVNEELYTVNAEHQSKIEELTTSNNDIDNFIRSTDIGTVFVDSSLRIKRYTPAISNIFELLPQDIGRPLTNFTHSLKFAGLVEKVAEIIQSRKTFTQEVETQEGAWFFMRLQPYFVKGGACEGAVMTFFDVHELKKAHHELVDKESRYRALIEATSAVVWEIDNQGEFLHDMASWCAYTGQKPEAVKNLGWFDAVQEDVRDSCKKEWLKSQKQGKAFHFETKVWSQAGNAYHYVRLEGAPHVSSLHNMVTWICSLTDIDEAKRFDEKFRLAIQASPYTALIVNQQGRITFANESTRALVGYSQQELLDQPIEILLPEDSRERHARFRERYMQNPSARLMASGIQIFVLTKEGKQLPVEVRLSPIHTDEGLNILCSMSDISLRIQAEEILQRSTEELELNVFNRTRELVEANEKLLESEKRYSMLYEDAPDMYASVSPKDASIVQCNATLVKTLGYKSKKEIVGRSVFDFYSKTSRSLAKRCFKDFKNNGVVENTELELLKKDRSSFPVMLKVKPVCDEEGKLLYSLSSWRDISVIKALEKEKQTSLELDLIYRSTQIVSDTKDFHEAMEKCIETICKVTDWPIGHMYLPDSYLHRLVSSGIWYLKYPRKLKKFKEVVGHIDYEKNVGLAGTTWASGKAGWADAPYGNDSQDMMKVCQDLNVLGAVAFPIIVYGQVIAVCEFFSQQVGSANKELMRMLQTVGEQVGRVLERKQVEQQLESLAHYDVITSLPNRVYFQDTLSRFLSHAKRKKHTLALLYLDLDNFKKVNDTLGHPVGDKLLKKVALEIKSMVRSDDFAARLGGDEFVVLMNELNSYKQAVDLAERVIKRLAKPFYIENHEINTSISVGIALYPDGGDTEEKLQKSADIAMYRAKEQGKNNFQFYSDSLNKTYQRQAIIEQHLRHAIKNDEFYLLYQPQVSIKTGCLYGVEALIRWKNSKLGEVLPAEFIPIAEDAGLISLVGDWVLEEACKQFKAWDKAHSSQLKKNPLTLSVNMSVLQLLQENTVERVNKVLKKLKLAPKSLTLEVTETALMLNLDQAIKVLTALSQIGVGIAIDDFGTGYSSLSYLKQLPFNSLKIDQSFVQDVTKDPNDASIVKAIVQLGSILELETLAEGVETKAQLNFLKDAGCHYAQGYHFAKPLPAADIAQLIVENKIY
jgi:two-component system CheB/CheR fusion protein